MHLCLFFNKPIAFICYCNSLFQMKRKKKIVLTLKLMYCIHELYLHIFKNTWQQNEMLAKFWSAKEAKKNKIMRHNRENLVAFMVLFPSHSINSIRLFCIVFHHIEIENKSLEKYAYRLRSLANCMITKQIRDKKKLTRNEN